MKTSTRVGKFFALIFIGFALVGCSKPKSEESCGFVQNVYGERVSWKNNLPVRMFLHTSVPAELEPSIRAAADTWNRALGKIAIVIEMQKVSGSSASRDGRNVIYYMNQWEREKSAEQGRTSLYWVGDLIQEADIRINDYNYNFYGATPQPGFVSMESLALHELGHVLGLKHEDASPSVMATYLRTNQERNQLQQSDWQSLSCEY
jgi:hypothetical protein